jgi:hypothetical protein
MMNGPEMEETVKRWLTESNIFFEIAEDEAANFHLLAEFPEKGGNGLEIINPKDRPDAILIVSNVSIDPMHQTALQAMPGNKRQEFLGDLVKTLIFQPVGFIATPDMEKPENIQLMRDMYADGISKTVFMDGMNGVNRCIIFIVWKFGSTFLNAKPTDVTGSMYQ